MKPVREVLGSTFFWNHYWYWLSATTMMSQIVDLASEALNIQTFRAGVIEMMQSKIGAEIGFYMPARQSGPFERAQSRTSGESAVVVRGAAHIATLLELHCRKYETELLPLKQAALSAGGVAIDTEVFGERRTYAKAYFCELARPVRGRHSLVGYVQLRGTISGVMVLGRTGSSFSSNDQRMVRECLPALAVADASFRALSEVNSVYSSLTRRESEVLELLCLGYTNREIARGLGSSPNTVRNQLATAFKKIGATTRAEAVAIFRS